MGNNPNQFIQCGFSEKDVKKQIQTTKEYAIKYQRSDEFNEKLSSGNSSSDLRTNATKIQNNQLKTDFSIPEHENLTKVSKKPMPNFVRIPQKYYYEEEDKGKCLDEIIESRYHTSMHFPQPQMISLLEALVYSLAYLTKKRIPHHDFYPTNIYYSQGKFQLQNPCTIPGSGYSLTKQRKRFSFLSPELILQVLNDTAQENISGEIMDKSDVFAIGMILLQFSTLQPSSECYDAETYNIIDSIVQERVNKCSSIYNPLLSQCIDLMLQYEVGKRIPPTQLSYAVHNSISNIKMPVNPLPHPNRMSMSGKVPPQKLNQQMPPQMPHQLPPQLVSHQLPPNMIQTRLPTGEIVVGLPPGLVQGGPNIHMPQQPMQHHFSVHQKSPSLGTQELRVEKMKLNPFEQIQQESQLESDKKVQPIKSDNQKQTLQERVQRILEASRTLK